MFMLSKTKAKNTDFWTGKLVNTVPDWTGEVTSSDNRDLKQTDVAAERRRSTSKFLFKMTQGQVNSLSP